MPILLQKLLILFVICGWAGNAAVAGAVLTLESLVVTAAPGEEHHETISSQALKAHKIVDLAEILADEMVEAHMIRKGGYGNEVSIRGFGQSDLRVLLDGSILEGACGSRKDPSLSHVNLLTVERLEVRSGPFDVTRPGILGGGINVVTKKPQAGRQGEVFGKAGSADYHSGGFYLTGGRDDLRGLFGASYSEADPYRNGDGHRFTSFAPSARPYSRTGMEQKAFTKKDLWVSLAVAPSEKQQLSFTYNYGSGEDILAPRAEMDIEEERSFLSRGEYVIHALGRFSERLAFSLYRNQVEHRPSDKYRELVAAPFFHRHNEAVSTITGARIENRFGWGGQQITCGGDFYRQDWNADMYRDDTGLRIDDELIPEVMLLNGGAYLQVVRELGRQWLLEAGVRYDRSLSRADADLKQSRAAGIMANRRTDDLVGGYLSLTRFWGDNFSLFTGLGRGFRTPTGVERYLQSPSPFFHGNPELRPTVNTEIDGGVQYENSRLSLRLKAFYSDLDDYIYQQGKRTAASHQTWTNIDAHLYGADFWALVKLGADWSLEAAAAWQKGRKDSQPELNQDRDLARIPPLKSRLALHYDRENRFATLEWLHSEKAAAVDVDAGEQPLSGWNTLNLRGGWRRGGWTLNAGIENLLDENYAVANSYEWDVVSGSGANPAIVYEPGRFFYASLSRQF
ncbi:MAG TPA: TonB-dependent receptor [Proteobacteria bacterium]|nr:TonB-dependent receptor [Pseudomonadota bacterium]